MEIKFSRRLLCLIFAFGAVVLSARGQEIVEQTFDGSRTSVTPVFQTSDKWELRWDTTARMNITLLSSDGAVVAGTSVQSTGSLYQAKGGSFYLQIDGADDTPWHVRVVELANTVKAFSPTSADYIPPSLAASGQTNSLVVAASPSAPSPVSTSDPTPGPPKLSQEQSRAVVVIKGDVAEGTGFLAQTADGPVVITNNHVIAANPNIRIMTSGGMPITILSVKGAVDRDLVMFSIKDDRYSYLNLDYDVDHDVSAGDDVLTPGNSEGGEVVLTTDGDVVGVGPDKIEVSNPIYHGNSGGPIVEVKSGKVIGVITMAVKVTNRDEVDKASYANSKSAIVGAMRYFGFRIDSVPKWEAYDMGRFLDETSFLKQFHNDSRCIDSLLNGRRYEKAHLTSEDINEGAPGSHFYMQNDKLLSAVTTFREMTGSGDDSHSLDAQRELLMNLQDMADKDIVSIQSPDNFYGFDQIRAKTELAYRTALKKEINSIGNKPLDLGK